jgi:hypothetical protein
LKKRDLILIICLFSGLAAGSQTLGFSIASDLGIQRSFKKEQRYWAVGHTVQAVFHFSSRDAAYAWISYYSDGKFGNNLVATAKSPATAPSAIPYRNEASMRFKHFSLGWKRYLKGRFDSEDSWNLYAYGGFGIILGRVINSQDPAVDTNDYDLPVRPGKANFKRLTLDLGLGYEIPIGADLYFYAEGRAWIPTTEYPSRYIFVNDNAPVTGMLNAGIRILF